MIQENPCNREYVLFHGYKVLRDGIVISKKGKPLKTSKRIRKGGGIDLCVTLYYNGTYKKWTLQRLIAACFLGPIHGYQINHKDRNTLKNNVDNLERVSQSQNQLHWRNFNKETKDESIERTRTKSS